MNAVQTPERIERGRSGASEDAEDSMRGMRDMQSAILNVLEDFEFDRREMRDVQRAVLNVLEDSESEQENMQNMQHAALNILEDFDVECRERASAEHKVRRMNDELEARVVERTAALSTANHELEAFAYSVSHDLRAPLRAIDGFSLIIADDYEDLLDEGGKDAIRRVRQASQLMGALIDDMLTLARSTRGPVDLAPVDLSAIAEAVGQSMRVSNPSRTVEFRIFPSIFVFGDGVLLRSILNNLLSNAWKFTANLPCALIEFGGKERESDMLCYVRDNGAGFDMDFVHNLFVPFQRLHRTSEFSGNGIGLASVKRSLARMGGDIWAEGEVNKGATFYFRLPRVDKGDRL
jgi:light-regulated signal transduction histidine kinase (bacteriophytochrome)